jgi:hypothetical protein
MVLDPVQPRTPLRWTFAVALAAHAAVAVWAARAPQPSVVPGAAEALDVTEAAIEVEAPPAEPSATAVEPASAPHESSLQPVAAIGLRSHAAGAARVEGPAGPAASSEPAAPDGTWAFNPTTGPSPSDGSAGPGALSDRALESAMNGGVGAVVTEYAKKREGFARKHAFLPVYTARDLELGLVPGGALVTLTRDLVRRSLAPDTGRALLQFDTDGAGVIASVRVLDVSSERAEWVRVADAILASSHGTTLRVPAGASGVAVTVEVTSAMKTVDGVTAGEQSAFGKALRGVTDPVGTLMDATTRPRRVVATRVVDVQAF